MEFHQKVDELAIIHEHAPPDTPQYNGVAKRALGLLREKTIALLQGDTEDAVWAEAMQFACDMTNVSPTTFYDGGMTPHELWYGTAPLLEELQAFGTVGNVRMPARKHKQAP